MGGITENGGGKEGGAMGGWIEDNPERRAMTGVGKDEREMDGEK